jgi:hypothetical protein
VCFRGQCGALLHLPPSCNDTVQKFSCISVRFSTRICSVCYSTCVRFPYEKLKRYKAVKYLNKMYAARKLSDVNAGCSVCVFHCLILGKEFLLAVISTV